MGKYKEADPTESCFNDLVLNKVVETFQFKAYQFVEKVASNPDPIEIYETRYKKETVKNVFGNDVSVNVPYQVVIQKERPTFKIDTTKCRRHIAYYSEFNFPVYSVMDIPRRYDCDNDIRCGFYYITTELTFPARGCGWYAHPSVLTFLRDNLITREQIKLEFLPSKQLSKNYFKKPIDNILKTFACEPDLQKIAVNAWIGMMGRTKNNLVRCKLTKDKYEAADWLTANEGDDVDVFIRTHTLDNHEKLHEGIFTQPIISETTQYPIYKYILELEALNLYELEKMIIAKGGIILDRNMDAIRYYTPDDKEIDFSDYFWDKEKTKPKFKREDPKELQHEALAHFKRAGNIDDESMFDLSWNILQDIDEVEEMVQQILESKKSIQIDGRAGTGKSYLLNRIIAELQNREQNFLAYSPTNKGARIIRGKTIDSMYHKFQDNKSNNKYRILYIKIYCN